MRAQTAPTPRIDLGGGQRLTASPEPVGVDSINAPQERTTPGRKKTGVHPVNTSAQRKVVRRHPGKPGVHPVNTLREDASGRSMTTPAAAIRQVAPGELTLHPDVADVAELTQVEQLQLEASIRETGRVLQPLVITSAKQVLDGRHRRAIAVRLGLQTVPVIVDDSTDAITIAISSALDRRQLSQGQRALYVFKLHRALRADRDAVGPDMSVRREAGGKKDVRDGAVDHRVEQSFRDLSRRYNVALAYFSYLSQMWNNSTPEEWAVIVRRIESGESELTQEYKGFCGRVLTKNSPRPPETVAKHFLRLSGAVNSVGQQGKHWNDFDTTAQARIQEALAESLAKCAPEFVAAIIKIGGEVLTKPGTDQ